jgi:transcriptional regulator
MANSFEPLHAADVKRLVDSYPLCWVVTGAAEDRLATPLPLLAEPARDGAVKSLLGHIPKAHPQCRALESDARASILCLGPNGYVSPRLVSNPTWGPTWNYASCRFEVSVEFVPQETDLALSRLAEALEGQEADAWTVDRMGERYDRLKQRIVAFRGHVLETHARFKLGQDEDEIIFREIVDKHANPELARWMCESRP